MCGELSRLAISRADERTVSGMTTRLLSLRNSLAKTVAAIAIALFWCISAVGATIGTTVGVTTLATAINAVTSTPAAARRYWRGRRGWGWGGWGWGYRRRRRRRRYWY